MLTNSFTRGGFERFTGVRSRRRLLFRELAALLRRWRQRCAERQALARLDYRMLRDIGITPCDVARECDKPFWR